MWEVFASTKARLYKKSKTAIMKTENAWKMRNIMMHDRGMTDALGEMVKNDTYRNMAAAIHDFVYCGSYGMS